jgi:hypothetical protein
VERNRNMPPTGMWRGWTPWGGLVLVGDDNAAASPPTTSQASSVLARGFPGRRNYWTFVFESDKSLWLLQDMSSYRPASRAEAAAFEGRAAGGALPASTGDQAGALTRPVNLRTALGTSVVRWVWRGSTWSEEPAARVAIPDAACYSLAGRVEGAAGWVAYTTSRSTLFRVVAATRTVTEVRRAPLGTLYRGVVLPPRQPPRGGSAPQLPRVPASLTSDAATTVAATPTATPSRSRTRTPPATRSKSQKSRGGV